MSPAIFLASVLRLEASALSCLTASSHKADCFLPVLFFYPPGCQPRIEVVCFSATSGEYASNGTNPATAGGLAANKKAAVLVPGPIQFFAGTDSCSNTINRHLF